MGAERDSDASARKTISILEDSNVHEVAKDKLIFFAADNAGNENKSADILRSVYTRMQCDFPDTTHSLQLAIKNGLRGEPEIEHVQAVLLTNKKPLPSISNILRHSQRFRSSFTDEQQDDVFGAIEHLGWSPNRMTSRSKPFGRLARKVGAVFSALAKEAEGGAYKKAAIYNLQEMVPYRRMMVAGLLADLTAEHRKCVASTDYDDADITEVAIHTYRFEERCRVLFTDGLIMAESMSTTFTSEVIKLYRNPSALFCWQDRHVARAPEYARRAV